MNEQYPYKNPMISQLIAAGNDVKQLLIVAKRNIRFIYFRFQQENFEKYSKTGSQISQKQYYLSFDRNIPRYFSFLI